MVYDDIPSTGDIRDRLDRGTQARDISAAYGDHNAVQLIPSTPLPQTTSYLTTYTYTLYRAAISHTSSNISYSRSSLVRPCFCYNDLSQQPTRKSNSRPTPPKSAVHSYCCTISRLDLRDNQEARFCSLHRPHQPILLTLARPIRTSRRESRRLLQTRLGQTWRP